MRYEINKKKKEKKMCGNVVASMIITCKGRMHHLKKTIQNMIGQICDFKYEIIIVDYGDPGGCFDWCKTIQFPNIVAIKVLDDTRNFNLARARNCGAKLASGEILCFVDADVMPKPYWLFEVIGKAKRNKLVRMGGTRSLGGTCAVPARIYHLVRGYNEALCNGWGHEENDFYSRCRHFCREAGYNLKNINYINHNEYEGTKFCKYPKRKDSSMLNKEAAKRTYFLVNPNGYGVCGYEFWKR